MKSFKKPILAALIFTVCAALFATAAFFWFSGQRKSHHAAPAKSVLHRPATFPPTAFGSATFSNRRMAVREARRCLQALCETGAADNALMQTRSLVAQFDAASMPIAPKLSAMLKRILAYRDGKGREADFPGFPGLSRDLLDRAAAACDARSRRKPDEIVLSFAGDCTFGTVNGDGNGVRFPAVYRRAKRRDYPFALVRPWFLNDDLTVVNFECTLTNAARTADKQWKFQGDSHYADIFPAGSVEAVGLSNNHSMDYLQTGFDDTVANFHRAHVPAFYLNAPYRTHIKGVEVVLIGDCTVVGENTTRLDGVPARVLGEIKRYKEPGNIVIVVMHWGSELDTIPRPWQQALGRRLIDAGADAVVGHHPHVVQGIELYKGKYIAYSLGNFAFGGNSLARFPETFVLRLRFHVGGGKPSVLPASIVPCWTTSSRTKNEAGVLQNDYQPKPVFGEVADRTAALVLARSARLRYGITRMERLRL